MLLADTGYDADRFRDALAERGLEVGIPPKSNRKIQLPFGRTRYRKRLTIKTMLERVWL